MDAIEAASRPAESAPPETAAPIAGEGAGGLASAPTPEEWPEPPHWTLSECQVKGCGEPAGARTGDWIICLDHADDWLDRIQAIELHPHLRELLPALGDE